MNASLIQAVITVNEISFVNELDKTVKQRLNCPPWPGSNAALVQQSHIYHMTKRRENWQTVI